MIINLTVLISQKICHRGFPVADPQPFIKASVQEFELLILVLGFQNVSFWQRDILSYFGCFQLMKLIYPDSYAIFEHLRHFIKVIY